MSGFIKIISLVLSFFIGFITYPVSFFTSSDDNMYYIPTGEFSENSVMFNGESVKIETQGDAFAFKNGSLFFSDTVKIIFDKPSVDWFNYYGISYCSDAYIKGTLCYRAGVVEKSEDFFLEPSESINEFYSFIDNCLENTKANAVISVEFQPLNKENGFLMLNGFSVFNRTVLEREIFIENENYKLGIDLLWGGALSYLEDKNSDVEAVRVNGVVKVDSNASERYNAEAISKNVNLINRCDTGRLVQQSYYGTASGDYEPGTYMGNTWSYNPVQGGNQYNDSSKIVDIRVTDNSVYVKCRPLDWAKSKEHITPSYMEATYEFTHDSVHAECRFVDFSEYNNTEARTQEIPAFYCIEPLNKFVYYAGNNPWSDEPLATVDDLIFWPDAGYPNYTSSENWAGFTGEFSDSFGIGIYVPGEERFLTGVYQRGTVTSSDPSVESATSYIAVTKDMVLRNYEPFEYEFYITTGDSAEIRNSFREIK